MVLLFSAQDEYTLLGILVPAAEDKDFVGFDWEATNVTAGHWQEKVELLPLGIGVGDVEDFDGVGEVGLALLVSGETTKTIQVSLVEEAEGAGGFGLV